MNWIKKTLGIGEKIKRLITKHRPTKEETEKSDWTSCCKGPILKKDLEENLWCCNLCGKHHRINSRQRFDVFFGKNNYELFMNDFRRTYDLDGDQLSFLSYDLIGLVYFLIYENNFKISKEIFYKKNKFRGKIGIFEINKNTITHQLNFYSIEDNKFKKIF